MVFTWAMTASQYLGLSSALIGALGAAITGLSSYALEPFHGAPFGTPEMHERNRQIRVTNVWRIRGQRAGMALITIGFVLQAASVLTS